MPIAYFMLRLRTTGARNLKTCAGPPCVAKLLHIFCIICNLEDYTNLYVLESYGLCKHGVM